MNARDEFQAAFVRRVVMPSHILGRGFAGKSTFRARFYTLNNSGECLFQFLGELRIRLKCFV